MRAPQQTDFYQHYVKVCDLIKTTGKIPRDFNGDIRKILKAINSYSCNKGVYKINEISEIDFNIKLAEIKNRKCIYVFDAENNLVYASHSSILTARKYNKHLNHVLRMLVKIPTFEKEFYYSYNRNFKIPIFEPKLTTEIKERNKRKITKHYEEDLRKFVDSVKNNKEFITMGLNSIASHLNTTTYTIKQWAKKYPFFKDFLDYRERLLPEKERVYKNNNDIYFIYKKLWEDGQDPNFRITNYDISASLLKNFKDMELYYFNQSKGYDFGGLKSQDDFMNRYSKLKKLPIIYVFNQQNEMVFKSLSLSECASKFSIQFATAYKRLHDPKRWSRDYYFSKDKDFKIIAEKPDLINQLTKYQVEESLKIARKLEKGLSELNEINFTSMSQVAVRFNLAKKTVFRFFKMHEFLKPYKDIINKNKAELIKLNKELKGKSNTERELKKLEKLIIKKEIQEKKRIERELKKKVKKIAQARAEKKNEPKKLSVEELIQKQKEREKQGLKIVRKDKRDYEQLKKDLKRLVNK